MTSHPLFRLSEVEYEYRGTEEKVTALRALSMEIAAGQLTCLSGPSGSGKSTLLNVMGLLDEPTRGKVVFAGEEVTGLPERERERIRLYRMGFVFQSFNLFPTLSAEENVEYFLVKQGLARRERATRVEEALSAVGILDQRAKRPHQMSGGQRQRVAIARTLAKRPETILADEPTASLDQRTGREVMEIFHRLARDFGLGVVIASHDPMVIERSDRNIRMEDGRVTEGAYR